MSDVLDELRAEWEQLENESASDAFFATWLWCKTWWKHFGANAQLAVITDRDANGKFRGLAPLSITRTRTRLQLLGWIGATAPVEHFDFLVRAGEEADVLPRLLARARELPHDVLSLPNILPGSTSLPVLRAMAFEEIDGHAAPVLELPSAMNAVLGALQKKKNERFRYYRRRIDRDFANDWSCAPASTREEVREAFDALVRLHQQHWTSRGEPGAFADERLTAFYRDLAFALFERGKLRMYRLIARGAIVSVDFAFVHRGRFHHFINGTDFTTDVDSPGAVLHYCMIEQCIAEGVREYDMMWGEHDYKYDWGAQPRVDRTFTRNETVKARAVRVAKRLVLLASRAKRGT